jgi:ABC-type branched-subunit amino acid transport system ATPase component
MEKMSPLEIEALTVKYHGAVLALQDATVRVAEGSSVALVSANGAGKTTLLRAVGGLLGDHGGEVASGAVRFAWESTVGVDPSRLVAAGIGQSLEGRRVFAELTVEQNLRLGGFAANRRLEAASASRCTRCLRRCGRAPLSKPGC